ncbi:MAG: FAD-binding oxidoreductase [Albidovulum sp.]|nr:FAD-binding oxidoreductase [Albidovulum sp.]
MKIQVLPKYEDKNGWWEILDSPANVTRLTENRDVNTAIIGGGIAGVSAAQRLAELDPSLDVAVLEAMRIGQGPSGKNSGFMLDLHTHGETVEWEELNRSIRIWESGLNRMREWVRNGQIECHWSEWGRIYGAAGADGEENIAKLVRTLDHLGRSYTYRSAEQLRHDLGTDFYHMGLFLRGNALCNPSALMRGLKNALPVNVTVFEESPVNRIEKRKGGFTVATATGQIRAERVVLATGTLLRHFGIARRRYFVISTYASMSEPLPEEQLRKFGLRDEFAILGASANGATIRLTRDGRLLFRNAFTHDPKGTVAVRNVAWARQTHVDAIKSRWPYLALMGLPYSWGGSVAITRNQGAVFGEFGDGLYAVLPSDIGPMTKGASFGTLLAEFMEGVDSPLLSDVLAAPIAKTLPPRPFLDLGIRQFLRKQARAGDGEY